MTKENSLKNSDKKRIATVIEDLFFNSSIIIKLLVLAIIALIGFYIGLAFSYLYWENRSKQIFLFIFLLFIFVSSLIASQIFYTTLSVVFNWLWKKNSRRRVNKQFTSITNFLEYSSFGKVSSLIVYLRSNQKLNQEFSIEIKNMKTFFENENKKSRIKKDIWELINYHNNFRLFCMLVETFSHMDLEELKNIETYLKIAPKKIWLVNLIVNSLRPIFTLLIFPLAVSKIDSFTNSGGNSIVDLIRNWKIWELLFLPELFPLVLYLLIVISLIVFSTFFLTRISKSNEHMKNYLTQAVKRAIEIKENKEETESF